MELHLDRSLSERRIFPAIDVSRSGTRNEELLLGEKPIQQVWRLRRMLETLNELERTELLAERLIKTASNEEFLENLHKGE
jgi:transcription termination factor Rho